MMSPKVRVPLRGSELTFGAAVGPVPYGTLNAQGFNPLDYLRHHGWTRTSITANPTPTTKPAEFGSFPNYLAARVGGPRAARRLGPTETTKRFSMTEVPKDDGEEPDTTEP